LRRKSTGENSSLRQFIDHISLQNLSADSHSLMAQHGVLFVYTGFLKSDIAAVFISEANHSHTPNKAKVELDELQNLLMLLRDRL
jgi:hypothetical protein